MDNIIDSIKKNSTLVIVAVVVSVIIFFVCFYEQKKSVEEFTGIPVARISEVTGKENHSIIVTTDPSDGKVNTLKSIPVVLSQDASITIENPGRPLPVVSPTTITNPNVLPKPISLDTSEPCPVDPSMSDDPKYICDKVALSPEDRVKLQGYEDETNLYVPCGLNYDYPGIYKYRILKKFDFDAKNREAAKYDYGKFGRYNTNLQTIYDDNCRRY